jgi:competence protein ComEA
MKTWWSIAFGVACGLLAAGLLLLTSSPPRGKAIQLSPPPPASPLAVHVTGAVSRPGVYLFPQGSRVEEALEAAGGLSPEADAQLLNLAAPLHDGERLWVPIKVQQAAGAPADTGNPPGYFTVEGGNTPQASSGRINLNTATQAELESLPNIGPVTAEKIIAYRQANGYFSQIEDIQLVSGIGPVTFEKIKDLISVGEYP